ncbi:MAG TPA: ADP-forming succinate--CoA ligase subunit beta [Bacillota bacterium]|jgi:succinyl-CoA synthetase beta subunit|nr:ADP-forming succinate--CoA ligase subunit beta [Bacillota bacterium]HOB88836.1 ADP-forming succinate--CoA ligase subunit beta [Bacillota bacterium]HOJ58034.1 ADP-forming succinate--CoA ligase subunit beta [Bacillota bacterium]HOL02373.1 ADP-forming succinate--CoA ligase subunit beta [Bacillota bacterium]HPO80755.1 ADP-forming succinate--CoA ligase subunit beta [Bacillota bacterium]
MKLHEYQAKEIMRRYGIPTPKGQVAQTPDEAYRIASELEGHVVVKAQVHVGGRGKAGGISVVKSPEEAKEAASRILGMNIKGLTVRKVLVEQAVEAEDEYYLGVTIDRSRKAIVIIASSEGGVDIEEVAAKTPEKISKVRSTPKEGFMPWQARALALSAGFDRRCIPQVGAYFSYLFRLFVENDAELAEINPLMLTEDGRVIAADAKITLDDNALFRHPEYAELWEAEGDDPLEQEARRRGLTYVKLNGDIGVIGNGAGLVMATIDAIKAEGGEAANFLDIGGGARAEVVQNALELILMDKDVKAILINVFGGITRCDEVAQGLIKAIESVDLDLPVVVRLVGTREKEGRALLSGTSVVAADTMVDAAKRIVAIARGGM